MTDNGRRVAWADNIAVVPLCTPFKTCCDFNHEPGRLVSFDLADALNSDACSKNSFPWIQLDWRGCKAEERGGRFWRAVRWGGPGLLLGWWLGQ